MRDQVRRLRGQIDAITPSTQSQAAIALIRILLQHAVLTLAEWVVERIHRAHHGVLDHEVDFSDLRAPTDGTLVDVFLKTTIIAENLGWNGLAALAFDRVADGRAASQFSTRGAPTLESVLRGFVAWRNDSVFGHGVGNGDPVALVDLIDLLLDRFDRVLPAVNGDGRFELRRSPGDELTLKVLRPYGGDLVCYRNIYMVASGHCVVRAQRLMSLTKWEEVSWEAEDVLAFRARAEKTYSLWETGEPKWCPIVLVPSRLTHHFKGREEELARLVEWANDEDSRVCMLYGDGGMGKTTLAVEFVHRLLDGSVSSAWRPEMVTFYTAKKTRWGLDGLEFIRSSDGTINDLAAEIYRRLSGKSADLNWFNKSADSTIDRLATFLGEWKIKRDAHLLILDNTETMATDEKDVRTLAKHVWKLARKVGRVLITSRRSEPIQAQPIDVPPLAPEESIALLRLWAEELSCQPIQQSGDPSLLKIASQLGNRPLTLEVFLRTLKDGDSLDDAFKRVQLMEQKDLGEFLYDDAWRRLRPVVRSLLQLMAAVADHHDEELVRLCCEQAGVLIVDAYAALAESRGIATVRRVDGHTEVIFNSDFLQFVAGKGVPEQPTVDRIRARYANLLKSKWSDGRDRLNIAYRSPYARAAAQALREGRFDDAVQEYQSALKIDPQNGPLFERYADALFLERQYEEALLYAEEGTRLAAADAECWFTRGVIESRLGRFEEAEASFDKAKAQGKPAYLGALQLAHAYATAQPPRVAEGFAALAVANDIPTAERGTSAGRKHLAEASLLSRKLVRLASAV